MVRIFNEIKKVEAEPRKMTKRDAWFIKIYPITESLEYMEKHKLIITKENYNEIRGALDEKFLAIENYVRDAGKEGIKVQFCLSEDLLPKIELSKKKEVKVEIRDKVKSINIDFNIPVKKLSGNPTLSIEWPKKEIQIIRKEDNKKNEFISIEKKPDNFGKRLIIL
jgi:hypothetical protein